MLGQWRTILRQAEDAARAGRLDEAATLTGRPDVVDHRRIAQLRDRLATELLGRASRRADGDDLAGALDDLDAAERLAAAPDTLALARLRLAEKVAGDVRLDLEAGEPARAVAQIDALAARKVSGPDLRRYREAAESWRLALDDARRGEFGRAVDLLDRAGRLLGPTAAEALGAGRHDIENRRKVAHPKAERLYAALAGGQWTETLAAAEALLESVPEHPAAREARTRAWRHLGALGPAAKLPPSSAAPPDLTIGPKTEVEPIRFLSDVKTLAGSTLGRRGVPMRPARSAKAGRFLLWADAIGGYLVCRDDYVVLGRVGGDDPADVPLLGDVSRHHATVIRDGDGYVLWAAGPTYLNDRKVDTAALRDGDRIRLGASLILEFRQPSPVSTTARLSVVSRHRLPMAVDGVILMGETCIIGPSAHAHVRAPNLAGPVVLYRQGDRIWCRAAGAFEVDGKPCQARAALDPTSNVQGEGFSFSLEPLAAGAGPA